MFAPDPHFFQDAKVDKCLIAVKLVLGQQIGVTVGYGLLRSFCCCGIDTHSGDLVAGHVGIVQNGSTAIPVKVNVDIVAVFVVVEFSVVGCWYVGL